MPRTKGVPRSRAELEKIKKKRKREESLLKEIVGLQNCKHNFIPKAPFCRLIKEILGAHGAFRITAVALDALQESCEMYLTQLFNDAYLLTRHRQRITLIPQDVQLVLHFRDSKIV